MITVGIDGKDFNIDIPDQTKRKFLSKIGKRHYQLDWIPGTGLLIPIDNYKVFLTIGKAFDMLNSPSLLTLEEMGQEAMEEEIQLDVVVDRFNYSPYDFPLEILPEVEEGTYSFTSSFCLLDSMGFPVMAFKE